MLSHNPKERLRDLKGNCCLAPFCIGLGSFWKWKNVAPQYLFKLAQEGRKAIAMDVEIGGEVMDLTTNAGFVAALYHTCRLSPGSGWLAAPVCSSFVFMHLAFMRSGNYGKNPVGKNKGWCSSTSHERST